MDTGRQLALDKLLGHALRSDKEIGNGGKMSIKVQVEIRGASELVWEYRLEVLSPHPPVHQRLSLSCVSRSSHFLGPNAGFLLMTL